MATRTYGEREMGRGRAAWLWMLCGVAVVGLAALGAMLVRDRLSAAPDPGEAQQQGLHVQRVGEWQLYDYPRATDTGALAAQRAGERRPGHSPAERSAALAAQREGERGQGEALTAPPAGWDAYRAGERSPTPR